MNITCEADDRLWAEVPVVFPTENFATLEDWSESVVARYAENRPDAPADPLQVLLGDIPVSMQPHIETVQVPGVGTGIATRFIVAPPGATEPVAGIGYLFSTDHYTVRIMSAPTTTTMVGLLDAPLRDVVNTMAFID
ncbi:hypothetical protein [Glaciibacter psychrotolerans]|uniref:Uncharacterized protein n=1 Tax=Glaciibacter psychrotolerans TaxID=670054 RepID=A0A7Z0EHE0_9MICO|nr:hypothetical protein [Leifsonia psychrotolerans]NYJ20954.1 hypothetical protein [Leifsonia psychrotolerans]